MPQKSVQFVFKPKVAMREVRDTLHLARMASEIFCGPERVALDVDWKLSRKRRIVAINTQTNVGRTFAIVFLGFARREFGFDSVQIGGHAGLREQIAAGALE